MKRAFLFILVCSLFCGVVYARRIAWKRTDKPPVPLREAILLAEKELKEEKTEYFCVGAHLAKTFSEGDWQFHFSSKVGKEIWVVVSSDKSVRKSADGFDYY